MYLTWKGKRASIQGIELAAVERVASGLSTDVLKRTGRPERADCYLSLVTADRSLDLCFEDEAERALWGSALGSLVDLECEVRRASCHATCCYRHSHAFVLLPLQTCNAGRTKGRSSGCPNPCGKLSGRLLITLLRW